MNCIPASCLPPSLLKEEIGTLQFGSSSRTIPLALQQWDCAIYQGSSLWAQNLPLHARTQIAYLNIPVIVLHHHLQFIDYSHFTLQTLSWAVTKSVQSAMPLVHWAWEQQYRPLYLKNDCSHVLMTWKI